MTGNPVWLGTAAAAEAIGVTTRTLYKFLDEGKLRGYRMGRVLRVRRDDVDAFIEGCAVEPGTLKHLYPPVAETEDASDGAPA